MGDPLESRMFGPLGDKAHIFETYNMTLNNHEYGISTDRFITDSKLSTFYKRTSYSFDNAKRRFVASMEAYDYPFFGV